MSVIPTAYQSTVGAIDVVTPDFNPAQKKTRFQFNH